MLKTNKLKKIVVDPGYIKEADFEKAKKTAKAEKISIEQALIAANLIKEEYLGQLIAEAFKVPYVNLSKLNIKKEIINLIPEIVAKKQLIIVFSKDTEGLHVAMNNPDDLQLQHFLAKKTGEKIKVHFATKNDILQTIQLYFKELKKEFSEIILSHLKEVKEGRNDKLPIIKIVEAIISYGYQNRASDIHIEPLDKDIIVRFRVDGVLHDVLVIPKEYQELIVSRIKILASLRTDEHQSAQDGKIKYKLPKEKLDIRVSVVPITDGEKIVMRLLSKKLRDYSLNTINLGIQAKKLIKASIKKPWGMVLVTGPTGSGKTTTLYAVLKELNSREVNISTIEDPVEYDMEGVNQIQVNAETNLTFAKGLRSILRQDPDIIMVGEIRDVETAKIALNAALTGHLVLSTLHTNDAATTLPRLLDMKIKPYLIASTVLIVVAQRLVRKICPNCISSYTITQEELGKAVSKRIVDKLFKDNKKIRMYQGTGCSKCHKTGYADRLGIFEVLEVTEKIRDLIIAKATSQEINEQAVKEGMVTMLEDGLNKAVLGQTTLEEVLRVTKE